MLTRLPIERYEQLARTTRPNLPVLKSVGLSVGIRGPTEPCTGYGQHVQYTADALTSAGYTVHVENTRSQAGSELKLGAHHLLIETPDFTQPSDWWFTMHETTRLPWDAFQRLNAAKHVIVPSTWNASCFNAQGLSGEIHVCPLGVNLALYRPKPRPPGNPFTFGVFGTPSLSNAVRKNFGLAVQAFRMAFGGRAGVRLQIKQLPTCSTLGLAGAGVEVISAIYTEQQIATWLQTIDVLVMPSRCEAFGFTSLQAMACGIPVIAAPYGGPADYLGEHNGYLVDFDIVPVRGAYAETGMWAELKVESMAQAMLHSYGDHKRSAKGSAALSTARKYGWDAYATRLSDILNSTGFFSRKQTVYKPSVVIKPGRVGVDDVVRFYADHPGSSKPKLGRTFDPETHTLTNTPTGMGDSIMMTDLPRAAALSRRQGSSYLSSPHFRDLIQFNPYYRDRHCPVWVSLSQVQMEYDLGPGHNFQKVRRLFNLPVDPRPSGCVIVPGGTVKRNRVSLHFEPGVHAISQRAHIHPRAREVYPENLDIVRAFIKRHPELEFFEVGGCVLQNDVPNLSHLPLPSVIHEMASCSLHIGIISGPYHLANALGVRTIVVINFPEPSMFMLPCMKNVDAVESEWLYPQSHVLHQDTDSPHWPRFTLKTLEMAYQGETYPYEDPTPFLNLVNG
jgi:hypothetical protein